MTFTGAVGAACMYPLRAIIKTCVMRFIDGTHAPLTNTAHQLIATGK